uniref:Uncharacterized protein LOC104228872 n=1 Tax=Nicotiana sylvestris TaxID=4096 RepID=A0A1U7WIF4_NICSY|nr:PREDICTED: uncharacterized protein LOC104228872 [Nicotiana sylvestris]
MGASEIDYVMREVHEGVCENHSGANSLVLRLIKAVGAPTSRTLAFSVVPMAIHEMTDGHSWSFATGPRKAKSTGETPFSIVYGVEALIPVEVGKPTIRFYRTNKEANNEVLLVRLDLLDEHRDLMYVRMAAQKQRMEMYYSHMDNILYFKVGDLVLRKVTQITREVNTGKLGSKWEGPSQVSTITGKGSYELENQDGLKLPSNWNVTHLKRYYCR